MRLRLLMASMSVLLCAACATTRSKTSDVKGDYRFEKRPGSGLIVLSTRFESACDEDKNRSVQLLYVDDAYGNPPEGKIPVQDWHREPDFQDPPGYFIVRELRAGQHFFKNELAVGDIFGPVSRQIRGLTPFTVEVGKATYLGEILVRRTDCNQPAKAQLLDQWERDSKLFDDKMTHLRSERVVKKLLTGEPYGRAPWASN